MIIASYAFLPHIRVSVVIIFKSVGYTYAPLSGRCVLLKGKIKKATPERSLAVHLDVYCGFVE
ncbi:hypothetical protein [Symbiopectobacterium sp. RP]|uniref:hypothetical protein n=1 Tax=Symbiopectobacterium sp. RP TaxID=3248553 RepID=UPI003D2B6FA9